MEGDKERDASERFSDPVELRKVHIHSPEGYVIEPHEVDDTVAAFAKERANNPEQIGTVVIDHTLFGSLAISLSVIGSEGQLHGHIKQWGKFMYAGESAPPVGHRWSISRPSGIEQIAEN